MLKKDDGLGRIAYMVREISGEPAETVRAMRETNLTAAVEVQAGLVAGSGVLLHVMDTVPIPRVVATVRIEVRVGRARRQIIEHAMRILGGLVANHLMIPKSEEHRAWNRVRDRSSLPQQAVRTKVVSCAVGRQITIYDHCYGRGHRCIRWYARARRLDWVRRSEFLHFVHVFELIGRFERAAEKMQIARNAKRHIAAIVPEQWNGRIRADAPVECITERPRMVHSAALGQR